MKENGATDRHLGTENSIMSTETSTKDSGQTTKPMEQALTLMPKVPAMRESGKMTSNTVMVLKYGTKDLSMKASM